MSELFFPALLAAMMFMVLLALIPRRRWSSRRIVTGSFSVDLGPKRSMLEMLVRHECRPVSHGDLPRTIWGPEHYNDTRYLRVHIRQLRRKLGFPASHGCWAAGWLRSW